MLDTRDRELIIAGLRETAQHLHRLSPPQPGVSGLAHTAGPRSEPADCGAGPGRHQDQGGAQCPLRLSVIL